MSDTPRTDGIEFLAQPGMMPPFSTVPSAFARELERELAKSRLLAGELIAVIRVNHANDRFAICTPEQLDEFLRPYIDRLNKP